MSEETSLHDDVEQAFADAETGAPAATPEAPAAAPEAPAAAPAVRPASRAPDGRYTTARLDDIPTLIPESAARPKPAGGPATAAAAPGAPVVPPAAPVAPRYRPPQWKNPDAVAEWDKLPPAVQQAVVQRERETHQALTVSSQARQGMEAMRQVLAPFSANISAYGGDAVEMIRTLAQVDGTLRFGTPTQKAQALVEIIRESGVDLELLDHALANLPVPQAAQQADQLQRLLDERLAPVSQFMSELAQRRERATHDTAAAAVDELQDFAAQVDIGPVREVMADLIEREAARGKSMTYAQAYEQACWLHPELRKAMIQREQAQAGNQAQAAASRARAASVSVSGAPALAGPGGGREMSLRDTISAAIDANTGRV